MKEDESEELSKLAKAAGLLLEWEDSDKRPRHLDSEVQRSLLRCLGFPADTDAERQESRRRLERLNHPRTLDELPPLITAATNTPISLPCPVRANTPFTLTLEDGDCRQGYTDAQGRIPAIAEYGYHRLAFEGADKNATGLTLAVAPPRCFSVEDACQENEPRLWALAVQLYALRRDGDGGSGDLYGLARLGQKAAGEGSDALVISPTHAMFSAVPDHYSPYSPSSRLLHNALVAAPELIFDAHAVDKAKRHSGLEKELARLEAEALIDWPGVNRAKLAWLRLLYRDFSDDPSSRYAGLRARFDAYRRESGVLLENHCRFEALQAHLDEMDWRRWPEEFQDPANPAVTTFAEQNADEVGFHAFLQWLVAEGLDSAQRELRGAGMRIGLVADLAVGSNPVGSQSWARKQDMLEGVSIGAPPDLINVLGQNWGLAAFSPQGLVRSGFRSFIDMLRGSFNHVGGLRIDHIMGLMRLWLIPEGESPTQGGYVNFPLDDMLRLVALESWRHKAIVIGEDLGTVAPGFTERLAAQRILGMQVLWFEKEEEKGDSEAFLPALRWSSEATAMTTTHDLATVMGWWSGRDLQWRDQLELLGDSTLEQEIGQRETEKRELAKVLNVEEDASTQQVLEAAIAHIGRTPSPLVILPMEDALGLEEQPNLPGTIDEHPNWRRRWSQAQGMLESPQVRRRLEILVRARREAKLNIRTGQESRASQGDQG
ncbi:4-alpha-glucanotransferase [Pistricoccus aurantiacus]|uniref:4-alpha-glucanotransferase n=1 Tax=Pistricoccus aurantiacus TaxID=1883414 RepID=UPI003641D124